MDKSTHLNKPPIESHENFAPYAELLNVFDKMLSVLRQNEVPTRSFRSLELPFKEMQLLDFPDITRQLLHADNPDYLIDVDFIAEQAPNHVLAKRITVKIPVAHVNGDLLFTESTENADLTTSYKTVLQTTHSDIPCHYPDTPAIAINKIMFPFIFGVNSEIHDEVLSNTDMLAPEFFEGLYDQFSLYGVQSISSASYDIGGANISFSSENSDETALPTNTKILLEDGRAVSIDVSDQSFKIFYEENGLRIENPEPELIKRFIDDVETLISQVHDSDAEILGGNDDIQALTE